MKISGKEAKELCESMVADVPALQQLADQLPAIIGRVIQEAGAFNTALEERISSAGKIPGDAVLSILVQGALAEILAGLPEGNFRRDLAKGGQGIGRFMARKYREKIADEMRKEMGDN